jgi:hypothetical protein
MYLQNFPYESYAQFYVIETPKSILISKQAKTYFFNQFEELSTKQSTYQLKRAILVIIILLIFGFITFQNYWFLILFLIIMQVARLLLWPFKSQLSQERFSGYILLSIITYYAIYGFYTLNFSLFALIFCVILEDNLDKTFEKESVQIISQTIYSNEKLFFDLWNLGVIAIIKDGKIHRFKPNN